MASHFLACFGSPPSILPFLPLPLSSPSGIPAIVDLGSAFTIANWAAGKLARLEPRGPHVRYNGQASPPGCLTRGV